ncbi:MAG: flagellar brake protein [Halioglobus sp.]
MSELPEVLDSTEEIAIFLENIALARNPLLINLADQEIHTSSVLSFNESTVDIDQLMPDSGNALLRQGQRVKFRVTHEGVPHVFHSVPIAYSEDDEGFPFHQISMPEEVRYLRKRSSYRIPLKLSESPKIQIWLGEDQGREAWIENISNSGASLRIEGKHDRLDSHSIIQCEMKLVDLEKIHYQAIVRHQHYLQRFDETRLGIEFWELPKTQAKKLRRATMKLQRQTIRTDLTL